MGIVNNLKRWMGFGDQTLKSRTVVHKRKGPGHPVFLMVGSVSGMSYRDVKSYVLGLADRYVVSQTSSGFHIKEDAANGRYIFEIHDGGPERSIIDKVMEALFVEEVDEDDEAQAGLATTKPQVNIQLANESYISIHEEQGEVYSLVYTEVAEDAFDDNEELRPKDIIEYCSDKGLQEVYPEKKSLPVAGASLLLAALCFFLVSGGAFVITQTGILNSDVYVTLAKQGYLGDPSDNPSFQLNKAKGAASAQNTFINKLTKSNGKWTWELKS